MPTERREEADDEREVPAGDDNVLGCARSIERIAGVLVDHALLAQQHAGDEPGLGRSDIEVDPRDEARHDPVPVIFRRRLLVALLDAQPLAIKGSIYAPPPT